MHAVGMSDNAAETMEERGGQITPDAAPTGNYPHLWQISSCTSLGLAPITSMSRTGSLKPLLNAL